MMMYYYKKYTLGYGVVDRDLLFTYYHQQVKKNEPHNLNERQVWPLTYYFYSVAFLIVICLEGKAKTPQWKDIVTFRSFQLSLASVSDP